ncbi:unnamed protein product, partial [Symbiodinium microadriaticum]
ALVLQCTCSKAASQLKLELKGEHQNWRDGNLASLATETLTRQADGESGLPAQCDATIPAVKGAGQGNKDEKDMNIFDLETAAIQFKPTDTVANSLILACHELRATTFRSTLTTLTMRAQWLCQAKGCSQAFTHLMAYTLCQ